MQKEKIILGILIVMTAGFLGLQIFNFDDQANIVRSFLLPILTVYYCINGKNKNGYFFAFLVLYSITELMGLFSKQAEEHVFVDNIIFYLGNLMCVLAYTFLFIEVYKSMDVKKIFNRFALHVFVLIALDIYSVVLVTDIAIKSDYLHGPLDYFVEITYNTIIMLLLTITLINYISRDSKKAMNLLLGSLCIVFSEVIQVAYYYVTEKNILIVVYSALLVVAFYFFYLQSGLTYSSGSLYRDSLEKSEV